MWQGSPILATPVVHDLARRTARASAVLILIAAACGREGPAPPATPTQPPGVVVIPAATATATPAPEPDTIATAEPTAAAPLLDPSPPRPIRFDRYRAAVENYVPTVQPGNITALNAARVPFATYLVAVHNRIHPLFADQLLGSLGNLPPGHPLNGDLSVHLEIVTAKDTGKIVRMGVTKASGATAFDVAALDAVSRAAPFGKAPDVIASPDGNVYLHWEFHRDPIDACTTRNARPYILKSAP
jgi:TonB family protein